MPTLTIYLARLIGLSTVLLVAALLMRGNALIIATVSDGPVMLVYAIFSLAAGTRNDTRAQRLVRRYVASDSDLGWMVDLREGSGAIARIP